MNFKTRFSSLLQRPPEDFCIIALAFIIALYHIYCALFGVKVPMAIPPNPFGDFLLPIAFLRKAIPQPQEPHFLGKLNCSMGLCLYSPLLLAPTFHSFLTSAILCACI